MKISDLTEDQIHIGMRVRSLANHNKIGTIVSVESPPRDTYWWIKWDDEEKPRSGFFWNHCDCEVLE